MSVESTTGQRNEQRPGRWVLIRDILSFTGGWALTFMEVLRPEVRESVLLLAGSLITVPGAAIGIGSILEARRAGTGGSPPEPASSGSSSSSP